MTTCVCACFSPLFLVSIAQYSPLIVKGIMQNQCHMHQLASSTSAHLQHFKAGPEGVMHSCQEGPSGVFCSLLTMVLLPQEFPASRITYRCTAKPGGLACLTPPSMPSARPCPCSGLPPSWLVWAHVLSWGMPHPNMLLRWMTHMSAPIMQLASDMLHARSASCSTPLLHVTWLKCDFMPLTTVLPAQSVLMRDLC